MHKFRLTTLADGIFSIVMTLLVIDLKVPNIVGWVTNNDLAVALWSLEPVFASFVLSFALLTTYWMAHHYIISIYAKNIDRRLMFWNMPFLMAISLVPFSAHLLGTYVTVPLAIWVYSIHVCVIGLILLYLFRYTLRATTIKNPSAITQKDIQLTYIRILIPPICAVIAIILSVLNAAFAIYFLGFAVIFNLIPGVVHRLDRLFGDLITAPKLQKANVPIVKARPVRNRKKAEKAVWVAR